MSGRDPKAGQFTQLWAIGANGWLEGPWFLTHCGYGQFVFVHENGDVVPVSSVLRAAR